MSVTFPSWLQASEFGAAHVLGWMRALPERVRLPRDEVLALVQTALWQAEQRGAELTRAYVALRSKGAVIDELRREHGFVGGEEGRLGRSNWSRRVVDIDDCYEAPEVTAQPEQEERIDALERALFSRSLLKLLPTRDRFVLRMRYLAGIGQEDCARALGVSAPRISQIEARALERAKKAHANQERRSRNRALDARIGELAELYTDRHWGIKRIASHFSTSTTTVYGALKRAGVALRRGPVAKPRRHRFEGDHVARLYREHRSLRVVAHLLGCAESTAHRRLVEAGVPLGQQGRHPPERLKARKPRSSDPRRVLAVQLLRDGARVADVARQIGRCEWTVQQWGRADIGPSERAELRRKRMLMRGRKVEVSR